MKSSHVISYSMGKNENFFRRSGTIKEPHSKDPQPKRHYFNQNSTRSSNQVFVTKRNTRLSHWKGRNKITSVDR